MDTVEITVEGYFNIIVSVLKSIAFVFQGGIVSAITGGVAMLYFLILLFRSALDSKQPNPFQELILILFLGIIFVGGTSAKLTVQLTQKYNLSAYAEVQGVPMIIALPYYFANRATDILKEETKSQFLPVELSSFDQIDPLQAISKLYYQAPPQTLLKGGPSSNSGYDFQKTMNGYFNNCVRVDYELKGSPPTSSISSASKATLDSTLFEKFKVDYDGFSTTVFLTRNGPETGVSQTCPDAWTTINNELQGNIFNEWTQLNTDSGLTNQAIAKSIQMITGSLVASPTAYDLQVGLFTARAVRQGIIKSGFETDLDMMIFQGQQQRMFQKLGERSMFENITKPVITMFEILIFFLTPIYTILMALGSKGLAHVGKYFMLIIFVSLWSYMNIFIDVFTYYILDETINASSGYNPFSFGDMAITMSEVESAVATAASAAQSVPFLLMFLMYGGVHSLMGAMRGLTDVKANGNFGAPSVTGPQNNGSRDLGNQNINKSAADGTTTLGLKNTTNDNMQTFNASSGITASTNATNAEVNSRVTAASENYSSALSDLNSYINSNANGAVDSDGTALSANVTKESLQTLSNSLQKNSSLTGEEADAMALSIAGGLGTGNEWVDIKGKIQESNTNTNRESFVENEAALDSAVKSFKESTGLSDTLTSQISSSNIDQQSTTDTLAKVSTAQAAYTEANTLQTNLGNQFALTGNASQNAKLDLAPYTAMKNFEGENVLEAGLYRDDGTRNAEFEEFLKDQYNIADIENKDAGAIFKEIKDGGAAADKGIATAGSDGNGSDAGVIQTILSDFNTSKEGLSGGTVMESEQNLEALRKMSFAIADEAESEDTGINAKNFAQVIQGQEKALETYLNASKDMTDDNRLNGDGVIKDVKGATENTEEQATQELAPTTVGVNDEESQAKIEAMKEKGAETKAEADKIEDKNKLLEQKVARGINDTDTTTGLAKAGGEVLRALLGEEYKDFSYGSSEEKLFDQVKAYNQNNMETDGGNAQIDPRMFKSLDNVIERATSGNGNFGDEAPADLLRAGMAINTINKMNENGELEKAGVDSKWLDRMEEVGNRIDGIFNPEITGKSEDAKEMQFDSKANYETYKAVSDQVANGNMELSSGMFALRELIGDNTNEASGWEKFFGQNNSLVGGEEALKNDFGGNNQEFSGPYLANSINDLAENASNIQSQLQASGVSNDKLDEWVETGGQAKVDANHLTQDELTQGDAVIKAANYAYSQRNTPNDFSSGDDSKNVTTGSSGSNQGWGGDDSYRNLVKAYDKALNNEQGDFKAINKIDSENDQIKMYKDNEDELRAVVESYGNKGNISGNFQSEVNDVPFEINASSGMREVDSSQLVDNKLMLDQGVYELQSERRIVDGEDVGQLFKDPQGNYMSMEYGKMRFHSDGNPNENK